MNLKEEKNGSSCTQRDPNYCNRNAHVDNHLPFHHHRPSDGPPRPSLSLQSPPLSSSPPFMEKTPSVKYGECLKNHAAAIGGNAIDGCGEFMPSGENDTIDALNCSACGCHRNFHRKQIAGDQSSYQYSFDYRERRKLVSNPSAQKIMPWSCLQSSAMAKRRHRTRFTTEQKEKMMCFAEKAGWRIQNEEEGMVEKLCDEIGVKRRAFKVWMHNNKNNFAKKANNLLLD